MKLTHPDKLYWPKAKISKANLAAYYKRIAHTVLPHLKDRPLSLHRYPEGIGGQSFFQKNIADTGLPRFLKIATLRGKTVKKNIRYAVCNNKDSLAYLANIGALELHPWLSRLKTLGRPDFMVFDLDPGDKTVFDDAVEAAKILKAELDKRKLPSFVKTSGKRGLHIYVPTGAKYTYDQVRDYAHGLAKAVVANHPRLLSLEVHPKDRRNKIYVDYLRNSTGQTVIAPYCPRATPEATVSTPLTWREVRTGLDPKRFTLKTIPRRLATKGDPWADILKTRPAKL